MLNLSLTTVKRTGFYPASACDYIEPLQLLKGYVDHLIFCDLNVAPRSRREIGEIREKIVTKGLPEASFFLGDALSALTCIQPVDVFFVRRDTASTGEGGSNLALLRAERIASVLNVIKTGGLLVVDRPNGFLWLTRMLSGNSPNYPVGNRNLCLSPAQPWRSNDLYSITVS